MGAFRARFATVVGPRIAIARLIPTGGAGVVTALGALNIALGLLPIAFLVATSILIGRVPAAVRAGVGSGEWDALVVAFLVAAGAFVLLQILTPLQAALGELLARRIDGTVHDRLMAASLGSTGIGPLEDQAVLDDLSEATRELQHGFQSPGKACAGLLALMARYLQLLGCAVLIGVVFSWLAAAALVVTTIVFRTGNRGGLRRYAKVFERIANIRREVVYFRDAGIQSPTAKEVRVFGLAGWLSERYRDAYLRWMAPVWSERRRIYLKPYLAYTGFGLLVLAVLFAATGRAAARGEISLTELAIAFQAVLAAVRLGEYYPEADTQTQFGMNSYDAVRRFEDKIASVPAALPEQRAQSERADARGLPRHSLHFDGVTFCYPGSDRAVLEHLDLRIPAGRCTAIVGLNGAGKTTLVKLLARLYEPSGGAVRVDGIDVRTWPVDEWRRQIGIIFQDFNRYQLTAAENIGFGAIELLGDRDRIESAAEEAGMLQTLRALPRGLDTPLSREYDGGVDLSGGQWQRVALARALLAVEGGARILVLDEPTAALDVRAEAEFFDRFVELTRGVTTLLISHRFSSVRHADHIVVLSGGRVVESGTHEELLERDGRYAELFRLQAERFTEGEPADRQAQEAR